MRKFLPVAVMILSAITFTTARAQEPARPLSAADKAAAVELLAQRLSGKYIYADEGNKMAAAVRDHLRKGDYEKVATDAEFADLLTAHIQAAHPDKHLSIRHVPNALPDRPRPSASQGMPAEMRQRMTEVGKYLNFSFEKVERLQGNIMYLKLDGFFEADIARAAGTAAMNLAANGSAMIIDLRDNHGGDPRMVAHLASYLLGDQKVHLSDIYWRADNETNSFWSDPAVPGARFGADKPVYVLTSGETFSAAEDFTYNLQAIKRITVVGEKTGGGAHPIQPFRIDPNLIAVIPVGRSINPITKGDWEGSGVKPDVAIAADKALAKANALALRQVLPGVDNPHERAALEKKLAELEAAL
ncbi:N-terminal domain of Peptidase_S41 [Duganella sp. CF402]|uniref:S41 family peptidase n=1 Tax=unclassified Duganella TaxID=2636909 RepID=UPI0008D49DEC|nr:MULTISPECIES: S41 family peptidase [unclassified Duganella]RZT05773.1 peptidase S41-like protein [Duganella sp. BK701]SEM91726.1 N-terminal domain of Peptidase_S41 [Duganella sp. CF402]